MRPQSRRRAIRVSVFRRRTSDAMSRDPPAPGLHGVDGFPSLYVPVISLAIEIPWPGYEQRVACDRFLARLYAAVIRFRRFTNLNTYRPSAGAAGSSRW